MTTLAASAHAVGFPCIVVQPFDWFDGLNHEQVVSLPVATPPLLPRSGYCKPEQRAEYGWRRSQLYRTRLWRVVLEMGLDLLAMDLDHMVGSFNPVPFLHTLYAPRELKYGLHHPPPSALRAAPADVVAVWDGPASRLLNVGIMWVRSTSGTLELARRSENRSFVAWEQQVFNEELNYNRELEGVRCCHTLCLKRLVGPASNASRRLPTKTSSGTSQRQKVEGDDRCNDAWAPSAYPPAGSEESWKDRWTPDADVPRPRHHSSRRFGRCNNEFNVCVHLDATGNATHTAGSSMSHFLPDSNCSLMRESSTSRTEPRLAKTRQEALTISLTRA